MPRGIEMCRTVAAFSDTPDATTRTFLSKAMRECHLFLQREMERLGMPCFVDPAGNLRGLYPAAHAAAPRLIIGSHLDTVPDAGAFDGVLGVVLGLHLIESLDGERLPFAIELIGFSEEEGVRFQFPFIGSRAFTGTLTDSMLERQDHAGISIRSAIEAFGLDPSRLSRATFDPSSFAYLEFHIEQGPVLDSLGQPLAVVDSISGQSRATVTFEGKANHAGTTPMRFRQDALAAGAEWIGAVENRASATQGLVATVGKLDVPGSATNIIPGRALASLDVRHALDEIRRDAFAGIIRAGQEIAARRGVAFSHTAQLDQPTVPMSANLVELAQRSIRACGHEPVTLASGAGHDAMIVAPFLPSVIFFLRSPNGLSHHPDESVLPGDVELALQAGLHFLRELGSTLPYE